MGILSRPAQAVWHPIGWRIARWNNAGLDRQFGIDTCGVQDDLGALGADNAHRAHGHGYEPKLKSSVKHPAYSPP